MSMQRSTGGGAFGRPRSDSLADLLERVLDKGVVIAGDIVVNVLDIELLTLKVRLLVASVDTAQQLGIDWWKSDPFLTGGQRQDLQGLRSGNRDLERRNHELEERVRRLEAALESSPEAPPAGRQRDEPA
jgi:hypothetical protein